MELNEIATQVNAIGTAWEEFKKTNDERLAQIEKKGSGDPLTEEKLQKINSALDQAKTRLDDIEAKANRSALTPSGGKVTDDPEHKKAFVEYLRKGADIGLSDIQRKALSLNSDPDGGYLVTPELSSKIINVVFETSPMRQVASVDTISSDSMDILEDRDESASGWVGETQSRPDTNTPTVGKRNLPVHEVYAQPKATQRLLDDASLDIEGWINGKVADRFARQENNAFINGNGVTQPRGILTYPAGTSWAQIEQVNSGSSGAVTADKLIDMFYRLKDGYIPTASWMMNRSVAAAIRQLKDSTNQYLWAPGLVAGAPDVLLGRPVIWAADMPIAASGSLSVVVGDFKRGYQIVDRKGIQILRDPFTDKPYVKFYATKRVGGDVINFEALKIMKLT